VDRRHPDRAGILRRWRDLVTDGLSLIIFPEGTRSADGRVGRFKAGSFMLAIEAGLPVVPLSIAGTRFVMRKGRLTVAPGDVTLAVHRPIETAGRTEQPTIDDARALASEVHAIISRRVEAIERARGTWPSS
jgi:1-acyl-sn-glycerol-3-phosphate acyltransferase